MKFSAPLSLATLSAALLVSLSANAHDPRAFDRMMEAEPEAATASACDELEQKQKQSAPADDDIKRLKADCDAEKKAEDASDSDEASTAKK